MSGVHVFHVNSEAFDHSQHTVSYAILLIYLCSPFEI